METLQTKIQLIVDGKIDPSFPITYRIVLEEGLDACKTYRGKTDVCVKVVIQPQG
ncbi:hypothetical protein [Agrobacterium rosae]